MRNIYLPNASTFVYYKDNNIIGFLSLVDTELAALFISPEHQHRGYGKQLIQFAKAQSQYLSLCVYKNNTDAIRFYLESGFTPIEERLDCDTNQMEIVMTWSKP